MVLIGQCELVAVPSPGLRRMDSRRAGLQCQRLPGELFPMWVTSNQIGLEIARILINEEWVFFFWKLLIAIASHFRD